MSSARDILLTSLTILALLAGAFFVGRCTAPDSAPIREEITRVDTLVVRDTITREKPVPTRIYVRDNIYIRDTLRDTVIIALPREVKVYEDSTYRAEVSGYQPSLDRIDIYAQERIVTQHNTQIIETKRNARWGVGIQAGYGATYYDGGVHTFPYIGVGLSWNILTF